MPSQKPPRPPAHDAKAANAAWRTLTKASGQAYEVFISGSYVTFTDWTRKLRDAVNANAIYLDDVASSNNQAHQQIGNLDERVAALEAQPPSGITFP